MIKEEGDILGHLNSLIYFKLNFFRLMYPGLMLNLTPSGSPATLANQHYQPLNFSIICTTALGYKIHKFQQRLSPATGEVHIMRSTPHCVAHRPQKVSHV